MDFAFIKAGLGLDETKKVSMGINLLTHKRSHTGKSEVFASASLHELQRPRLTQRGSMPKLALKSAKPTYLVHKSKVPPELPEKTCRGETL